MTTTPPPHLRPLELPGGRVAANRIWLAPMTNQQSHADGHLSDDELAWLEARAAGAFSVIQTCATHVLPEGQGWPGELGIFDDALLPDWRRLADRIHAHGALLMPQLFHGGLRSPRTLTGVDPISADAHPEEGARAATDADLERVIEAFAAAARRAASAGADGVELHGAHGYLLCQFLSTALNNRSDAWGGTPQKRALLLRRCLRAVRAATPADFIVGVRISPESYGSLQGITLDESLALARTLVDDGADFIHLSLWDSTRTTTARPGVHAITAFREVLPATTRIVVAGNVWTGAEADHLLSLGADAVALGRAAIVNPDWPRRSGGEGWEPIRPPVPHAHLRASALGPAFVEYMARWDGFVAD